jgi:hypothetical protein
VTDIVVSFAIGRMPANETGVCEGRRSGGRREVRREECRSGCTKTKKAALKDGLIVVIA